MEETFVFKADTGEGGDFSRGGEGRDKKENLEVGEKRKRHCKPRTADVMKGLQINFKHLGACDCL